MSLTHLFRFLTILALLFAPLAMMGGHAAMAAPVAAGMDMGDMQADSSDHCAGMEGKDDGQPASIDCMIACSAIPSLGSELGVQPAMDGMAQAIALHDHLRGLHPASDPPPPRFS